MVCTRQVLKYTKYVSISRWNQPNNHNISKLVFLAFIGQLGIIAKSLPLSRETHCLKNHNFFYFFKGLIPTKRI